MLSRRCSAQIDTQKSATNCQFDGNWYVQWDVSRHIRVAKKKRIMCVVNWIDNVKGITSINHTLKGTDRENRHQQQTQSPNSMYTLYTMLRVCFTSCYVFYFIFSLLFTWFFCRFMCDVCVCLMREFFPKNSFDSDRLFYFDDFPNFMGFVSP